MSTELRIVGQCEIKIGDTLVTPESPYLFALALFLIGETPRAINRSEICDLLFPDAAHVLNAQHSVRQLVYRLRKAGLLLRTASDSICLDAASTDLRWLDRLLSSVGGVQECLDVLPGYEPRISRQYTEWLEDFRARKRQQLHEAMLRSFRESIFHCDWQRAICFGMALRVFDSSDVDVARDTIEALLVTGRWSQALAIVDDLEIAHNSTNVLAECHRLRVRIRRAADAAPSEAGSFCGRDREFETLKRLWSRVRSGVPQLCLVTGPPGIGKTRLASEFSRFVTLRNAHAFIYHCDRNDVQRPYSLFTHLVPQLRDLRGSLGASPQSHHRLQALSSDEQRHETRDPAAIESIRHDLQNALVDLVQAVANETAIFVGIDDSHLLDNASLATINAIVSGGTTAPVLFVCCCRSAAITTELGRFVRPTCVISLPTLTTHDCKALLEELVPSSPLKATSIERYAEQSGGNPFYLHALARHERDAGSDSSSVPFNIRRLAEKLYFSLSDSARTLLECCLFLGRYASLGRVQQLAFLTSNDLVAALRRLEEDGLIVLVRGELRPTHPLLDESIRELVPSAVAAVWHHRVAEMLESECLSEKYPASKAWAAAQGWLASGELQRASQLLRDCASRAARIGEPRLAAQTLLLIPDEALFPASRMELLSTVVEYAELGGDRELALQTLVRMKHLAKATGASNGVLRELGFRVIEASLQQGDDPVSCSSELEAILTDAAAPPELRVRAGIRRMVVADLLLDQQLGTSTFAQLGEILPAVREDCTLVRRAELVYTTVFGDADRVTQVVKELIAEHPSPALSQLTVSARRSAAFALSRLGHRSLARPLLIDDYHFMMAHNVISEALYCLTLLAENELAEGNLLQAAEWLSLAESAADSPEPRTHYSAAGYFSAAATFALFEGRIESAQSLLLIARNRYPVLNTPRLSAISLALDMLIKLEKGKTADLSYQTSQLICLFEKGAALGGQDLVVAALWKALHSLERRAEASELLHDYKALRREKTPPEWYLERLVGASSEWDTASQHVPP